MSACTHAGCTCCGCRAARGEAPKRLPPPPPTPSAPLDRERMMRDATHAIATLRELATDPRATEHTRLRAARALVQYAAQLGAL